VKILVFGVELLVLSLVLRIKVFVLSLVCSVELTVEPTVLPPSHRILVRLLVNRIKILVESSMLSIEPFVPSFVFSVELVVQGLMFVTTKKRVVMSKDNRSRPQQAGKGENSKSGFLQSGLHKSLLSLFFVYSPCSQQRELSCFVEAISVPIKNHASLKKLVSSVISINLGTAEAEHKKARYRLTASTVPCLTGQESA